MALLDFLKNKKESDRAKETKKPVKKAEKPSVAKTEKKEVEKKEEVKAVKTQGKAKHFSYEIVREPHISEKGSMLAEKNNQYTFKVFKRSNKIEIKKAVEGVYGVNVLRVNIIQIPAKKRRLGKTQGMKQGYTKAVVTVKQGQTIEIL